MSGITNLGHIVTDRANVAQDIQTRDKVREFGDIVAGVLSGANDGEPKASSPEDQAAATRYAANVAGAHLLMGTGNVTPKQANQLKNDADFARRAAGGDEVILEDVIKVAEQVANNGDPEVGGTMILSVAEHLGKIAQS
ncbi:MAG: hypothetical protein O3C63_00075 [Cyanobacteria bacterium]|nr:hypothetical protein [Cyanobacteriota bacterium]